MLLFLYNIIDMISTNHLKAMSQKQSNPISRKNGTDIKVSLPVVLDSWIPVRRYFSRKEAAAWLDVSVDTFDCLNIRYVNFGPRTRRWDIVDIVAFAEQNKSCDNARTSETKRRRQICKSINEMARQTGGQHGTTRTANAIAEALGLKIKT